MRVLNLLPAQDQAVLDTGCGNGLNAVMAIACGAREVYALESDPNRCKLVQFLFESPGLSDRICLVLPVILKMDLTPSCIAAAYSIEFLEHIFDPAEYYGRVF